MSQADNVRLMRVERDLPKALAELAELRGQMAELKSQVEALMRKAGVPVKNEVFPSKRAG